MTVQQDRKIIFWIFGLLFSVVIYFLLQRYSSNPTWVALAVSLVIIFLFYIVGEILSHISGLYFYNLKNKNSNDILNFAKQEEEKQKIQDIIKKLKSTMAFVISQDYSEESIRTLNEYVGINSEETYKLIEITKKLIKVKWTYWIFGLCFSIFNIFLIFYIDYFQFLRSPVFIPIGINVIIFLLFYIEGIIVMKLPDSFYLRILDLKQNIIKTKNINRKESLEKKQQLSVNSIKNAIKYLIKMNITKEKITEIIIDQGFSKKAAEEIINQINQEQLDKTAKLPIKKNGAIERLFLSKIHDEFLNLKAVNSEINEIKENLSKVEEKQKEIEKNIKSLKTTKIFPGMLNTKETTGRKTNSKNEVSAEEGYKYSKEVYFLYNLILPQAPKYKKEDVESFLLYQNYSLETVEDLMELLKQNNIKFKKDKHENKIISFINKIFEKK